MSERQHIGLKKVGEWKIPKAQIIARWHQKLIELTEAYKQTDDPITRMEIRLEAMDVMRSIEALESNTRP